MKQITIKQATEMALAPPYRLSDEIKCCQADWIQAHARKIAEVECGRIDKTYFGEWPRGWKSMMKAEAKVNAEQNLLRRFLVDECVLIDGAYWLTSITMIESMVA
jgi:hypothetical protein